MTFLALPPRRGHPLKALLRKEPEYTITQADEGVNRLTFLGTAGFVVEHEARTLVLDPYISRPGIRQTLFGRLTPDELLLQHTLPYAHDVLVGHSHYDHALDAPAVCKLTGARLLGSSHTLNIARAYGLPAVQMLEVQGGQSVPCGPATATALPSRHGRVYFGRVTLPGPIPSPPPWPPRVTDLRCGAVYNWHLDLGGTRVLHVDSADFVDEHIAAHPADILCLCAIGRAYRPDYTRRIIELSRAKVVVPCHWDDFTLPYHTAPRQLPGVDVEGFVQEIKAAGARAIVLGFGQSWRF